MTIKKLAALLAGGVMTAAILTGCGGLEKDAAVAVFDETDVELGVVNFAARLQQASFDDFYVSYFGEKVWSSDLYGNGITMEENVKDEVMDSIHNMYVLRAHMDEYGVALTDEEKDAVVKAASILIKDNSKEALEALGADQTIVEEYLTLATIQSKMREAMIADADTNVSDEEANTGTYSYVRISKTSYTDENGNSATYTDAEKAELLSKAEDFAKSAKEGTLEAAAEEYDYTVSKDTFTADEDILEEVVYKQLKKLGEGEVSGVIDAESDYYVLRLDAATDKEETQNTRESIIAERQDELYNEVLEKWKQEHEWVVKQGVWKKVTFDNLFTSVNPDVKTDTENIEEPTEK